MIFYQGNNPRLEKAVESANELLKDQKFIDKIAKISGFDMSNASPGVVIELLRLRNSFKCTELITYKPWNRWSSAYARFQPSKSHSVQLSSRKLRRYLDENENHASLVGSIIHEFVHLADFHLIDYFFGHGGNNPTGKENTAPYLIGKLAKEFVLYNY